MPTPPTAERRHKSANLLTRYPREAVVHLPHLSSPPNIRFSLAICLLALTLLTACKPVGPNYNRPGFEAPEAYKETGASTAIVPPPNPAGGGWQKANPSDGMLRGKWWEIYQDPQLNQLEEQISPNGQPNNQQLRQAMETYLAARDQIKVARSSLYPTLSASPSASRNQVSFNEPLFNRTNNPNYNDYEITGQASWEPDFFGRIRRTNGRC